MLRTAPLLLMLAASTASATEFTSDQQDITYDGTGTAVNSTYVVPIGVDLDIIIAQFCVGVTLTLRGNAEFGLYVEGTSDLKWDNEDGAPGLIYQDIEPLAGSGLAALKAVAGLEVTFDIRDGGAGGNPYISFRLWSQDIKFQLDSDPFDPWLLPGSQPSSQTLSSVSRDLAFELPLYINIPIAGVVNVSFGPKITGYPQTTAVFGGIALATLHDTDIVTGGEIYIYEQVPEMKLISAYQAYVNTVIAYVFDIELHFNIDLLGFFSFPFNIPLWGQAFPLFSDQVDLIFPTQIYSHPVPMITAAVEQVNFGKVEIGTDKDFTVPINDDGYLDLSGTVELEGDPAFSVKQPNFFAAAGAQVPLVVTFEPTRSGDFTGTLRLRSNDPYAEVVEIPINAKGVKPTSDSSDPFGNDDNGFVSQGSDIYSTCGCDSQSGGVGSWTALGLGAVALLRRRRSV